MSMCSTNLSFGYGCKVEEHIRYGQCLDGKCVQRASWETHKNKIKSDSEIQRSKRRKSPLHVACEFNRVEVVEHLCAEGEPLNVQDNQGRTPLHIACRQGNIHIIRNILQAPVWIKDRKLHRDPIELNIQDALGRTCLHEAAINNHLEVVELLLSSGVDSEISDKGSKTALQCCGNDQRVYQILRDHSKTRDLREKLKALSHCNGSIQSQQKLRAHSNAITKLSSRISRVIDASTI